MIWRIEFVKTGDIFGGCEINWIGHTIKTVTGVSNHLLEEAIRKVEGHESQAQFVLAPRKLLRGGQHT